MYRKKSQAASRFGSGFKIFVHVFLGTLTFRVIGFSGIILTWSIYWMSTREIWTNLPCYNRIKYMSLSTSSTLAHHIRTQRPELTRVAELGPGRGVRQKTLTRTKSPEMITSRFRQKKIGKWKPPNFCYLHLTKPLDLFGFCELIPTILIFSPQYKKPFWAHESSTLAMAWVALTVLPFLLLIS